MSAHKDSRQPDRIEELEKEIDSLRDQLDKVLAENERRRCAPSSDKPHRSAREIRNPLPSRRAASLERNTVNERPDLSQRELTNTSRRVKKLSRSASG